MSEPLKWVEHLCDHCEGTGFVERVNPKWLRAKRIAAGLSVRAMARHMGLSAPYVSDIELGRRNGTSEIIIAYSELAVKGTRKAPSRSSGA